MSRVTSFVSKLGAASRLRWGLARSCRVLIGSAFLSSLLLGGAQAQTDLQSVDIPAARYYQVTRVDPRLCPSPFCGGVFVELVNRRKHHCADGSFARQCYVGLVDWSALGLSSEEEASLGQDFATMRVLARGSLETDQSFGTDVPVLVVSDAWRGVTGTKRRRGRFWGVVPSGIVCITFPCPVLIEKKLNSRHLRHIHRIDLVHKSGATEEQVDHGFDELHSGPGLLVFGKHRRIKGPAGRGVELVASEFYTLVESDSGPQACGGFIFPPNPPCARDEFCEQPPGTCQIVDLPGICTVIGDLCPFHFAPVCGCDGLSYANDCERTRAAVSLDHEGACGDAPNCGPIRCGPGLECCNPLLGLCVPPGVSCIQ